ncbi:MAG: hypothetical protein OXK73_09700 [Rhodospirillaceae bacterium]|nr:hypothetical protein [Rhodospirillaceae bacterium]
MNKTIIAALAVVVPALVAIVVSAIYIGKLEARVEFLEKQYKEIETTKLAAINEINSALTTTLNELRFEMKDFSPHESSYSMWMKKHSTTKVTAQRIPPSTWNELCADKDGCLVQLRMSKWNETAENTAATSWYPIIYDSSNGKWTSPEKINRLTKDHPRSYGHDGKHHDQEGTRNKNHLILAFWQSGKKKPRAPACALTDIEYESNPPLDAQLGIHLVSTKDSYNRHERQCGIVIRD